MLSKVAVLYLWILCKTTDVNGYSWVFSPPVSVSICSEATNTLYLNWTYTPATPLPFSIQWSRVDASGSLINIARFSGSPEVFTPQGPYVGRVTRVGSTAEIAITGPFTADDAGMYEVSVTPSSGSSLDGEEYVPYANVTQDPVKITSTEVDTFDFIVTCSLGSATNLSLEFWNGVTSLPPDTKSVDGITKTIRSSSGMTIRCSVTGQGSDCRTSNDDDVKLPVSTFVTTSIVVVVIIIIIDLGLVLLVLYLFFFIDSLKLIVNDKKPVDDDFFKKLLDENEMKVKPVIREKEVHIVLKKSINAKEIIKRSVPGRDVEIIPKRDDRVRKGLRFAGIICGAILILIALIFIGLKAAKCNGASSEGIFIGAAFVSVLGLIFGIATVVVLVFKMGGETKQSDGTVQ